MSVGVTGIADSRHRSWYLSITNSAMVTGGRSATIRRGLTLHMAGFGHIATASAKAFIGQYRPTQTHKQDGGEKANGNSI